MLKKVTGKRTPDAAIMRIRSEADPWELLELLAIFEVKPGPCTFQKQSDDEKEPQTPSSTSSPGRQEEINWSEADMQFKASYEQICEQASRALAELPPHKSIPAFFLTGFYFYSIMFHHGDASPVQTPGVPQFEMGTEDAGYNPHLQAEHARSIAKQRTMALKYEVKYFRERYIDHQGHLTAEFAAALQSAVEGQEGPALGDSWFTTLAKQGVANDANIVSYFANLHVCQIIMFYIGRSERVYR